MTRDVSVSAWLACGYAAFLLAVAFALDRLARRAATRTHSWRSGGFTYHEGHDAWLCPQDQWLWPRSFDPENRVMRYRGSAAVCNACPVKASCTSSPHGREMSRNVDPWPSSEAERFHRGIACALAVLAALVPLATALTGGGAVQVAVLLAVSALMALGSLPLWSHLRRTPSTFGEHVRTETLDEAALARAVEFARERRRRPTYVSDARRQQTGSAQG